nr:uncharacterized protein LOC127341090 isoform X5 [Lolium perenne]
METRRRARTRGVSMAIPSSLLHLSTILGVLFNTAAPVIGPFFGFSPWGIFVWWFMYPLARNRRVVHQVTRALSNLVDRLFNMSIHNYGEDAVQIWTGRKHTEVLMAQFGNVSIFLLARCHRKILQSNIVLGDQGGSTALCCRWWHMVAVPAPRIMLGILHSQLRRLVPSVRMAGSLHAAGVLHRRRCPGWPQPRKASMYLLPHSTHKSQQAMVGSGNKLGDGRRYMHRTWRQRGSI